MRKTNEEFLNEVKSLVKDEYTFLEEYKNTKTPILVRHNLCNHEYKVRPDNFLQGYRCPECRKKKISKKLALTTDQFKKKVYDLVGDDYSVLGEYKNNSTKILMKHNICGHEYLVTPEMFIGKKARRCPKCKSNKLRKKFSYTTQIFIDKILSKEPDYILLSEYTNTNTKIKLKHLTCNKIFEVRPNDFQQGTRCPYCNTKSKGELKIQKWLDDNNIYYEKEFRFDDCKNKRTLPFDFKLEDDSGKIILIEYDGKQHFEESFYGNNLEKQKFRDNIKNDYCNSHNIDLYRISYKDINNIDIILEEIIKKYE